MNDCPAEGWDPDRWDSLDIIQASGQVIRAEMGSSARSGSAAPAEVEQQDDKVRQLAHFVKVLRAEDDLSYHCKDRESCCKGVQQILWTGLTAMPHALDGVMALQVTMLPSSPAELLRHIQSDGYKQAQADQAQRVRGSFEVGPVCSKTFPMRAAQCTEGGQRPRCPCKQGCMEWCEYLPLSA